MCEEEKCVRRRNVSGGEMCQGEKCVRGEMCPERNESELYQKE